LPTMLAVVETEEKEEPAGWAYAMGVASRSEGSVVGEAEGPSETVTVWAGDIMLYTSLSPPPLV